MVEERRREGLLFEIELKLKKVIVNFEEKWSGDFVTASKYFSEKLRLSVSGL